MSPSPSSRSPATFRCWSTASRAISRCMISVEPSKIRLIRMSRSACSAGTGFSPRALSDAAVSYPRPPRTWISSSSTFHPISEPYSLASAASIRMSPAFVVGQTAGDVEHRLQAERTRRDERELLGDRVVLADRPAPLDAFVRPLARDLCRPLRHSDADRRQSQPPRVQRCERDLQALSLTPDPVLLGHEHVIEPGHRVLDSA